MTPRLTLQTLRKNQGLSRSNVADSLGITLGYYGMIESGTRQPRLDLAQRIAGMFDTTVEQIFDTQDAQKPQAAA